ncbi:MAG TPA: glycosyltransferase family 1 protein [Candidatus Dormibacteraeota bacterium]|nr:glycosyltransferase family 1 protein [Candidatus Dormibacteraeota bacterium]
MRIAVDSWTLASRFRCQGTYVYTHNLLREFKKIARQDSAVRFSLFASGRNGNDAIHIAPEERFELCSSLLLDHDRLWRFGGAGFSASRSRADVMFIPTAATLPVGRVPAVCTIHDVTPITMPSHSAKVSAIQRFLLKGCARLSRMIITSSECSKRDIVALLGVPEEKVVVIHDGCDQSLFNAEPPDMETLAALRSRLGIERPYLLHHGTIQPRKNLKRLIEAYHLMLAHNADLDSDLVLAGQQGWASDEIVNAATTSRDRGKVILAGVLGDSDLALLIKGARLAVVPSLYEGFSLPMVEAMACGVPTIASRTSCLPEISGNALAYFDPLSVEDMASCMHAVLCNSELSSSLRQKGTDRARGFTWERCARETLNVLKKVAQAGHH